MRRHSQLVRYFNQRGFNAERPVRSALRDLPLRLIWGGAGLLMTASCADALSIALRRWQARIGP